MCGTKSSRLWQKAGMTVEAVFIVPVLLGLVFMILYVLFLFHDRIVLQQSGRQALCSMADGTLEADRRMMQKEMEDVLWMMEIRKAQVTKKRRVITAIVTAQAKWEIPVMNYFMNEKQEICWTQKISCVHPEEVMKTE